jgi:L-lactate dehydrogenase
MEQSAAGLRSRLFGEVSATSEPLPPGSERAYPVRVTIVGAGDVGVACAYNLLIRGVCSELVLVDVLKEKLKGHVMDLQHGGAFSSTRVSAADSYADTAHSAVCIITAGVRQRAGESRLELMARNSALFQNIIPPLVQYSPETLLLVVSNPVDLLTQLAWRMSGLPHHRVIGSGTYLDSSRFQTLIAQALGIDPISVQAMVLGEHGDSSFVYRSGISVGGVPLQKCFGLLTNGGASDGGFGELVSSVHQRVVRAAYEVIELKGYTNWAIGSAVGSIVTAILQDQRKVMPVSTHTGVLKGLEPSDVFLSLPCVLGRNGVLDTLQILPFMDEDEREHLRRSIAVLKEVLTK